MSARARQWAFALIYVATSLCVEAALIVCGGLRVPRDNAILAPVVLTVPPVLATLLAGYRGARDVATVALVAAALTLVLTLAIGRLTGIHTGLAEPVVVRLVAGLAAAAIGGRLGLRPQPRVSPAAP
jgi:hypothetical protein